MKFDICVGNPPYGSRNKGSSRFLHYMILKTALTFCSDKLTFIMPSKPIIKQLEDEWYKMFTTAVCTNIQTVDKSAFPNTTMDKTAIYYCDRKASPNDYDKQLDVDKKIYNAIDAEGHRLFIDKMNKVKPIEIKTNTRSSRDEELKKVILDSALNSLEDGKYYLNTNRANGALGAKLISGDLFDIDVLNKDEEEKFIKDIHSGEKNIIECRTKEYGKNFSKRNLQYFRKFYLVFPDEQIVNACVHNLNWTHFRALLRVPDENARMWYMNEAAQEGWSSRTLDRNISTQYYYRLMQSPRKDQKWRSRL